MQSHDHGDKFSELVLRISPHMILHCGHHSKKNHDIYSLEKIDNSENYRIQYFLSKQQPTTQKIF